MRLFNALPGFPLPRNCAKLAVRNPYHEEDAYLWLAPEVLYISLKLPVVLSYHQHVAYQAHFKEARSVPKSWRGPVAIPDSGHMSFGFAKGPLGLPKILAMAHLMEGMENVEF